MSSNKTIGLIIAVIGAVITLVGALTLFLEDIELDEMISYAILAVGVIVVILGVLFMYVLGDMLLGVDPPAAKPAAKAAKPAAAKASAPKSRADQVNLGNSKLAKAMKYAADKIDSKVAMGKMSEKDADIFMGKVMAYAPSVGKDEDAVMISIGRLIGAIAEF
jgi:hypothetical protein